MHDFGISADDLAMVSVKNRKMGASNPKAQFQKVVTIEDVQGFAHDHRSVHVDALLSDRRRRGCGCRRIERELHVNSPTHPVHVAGTHLTSGVLINERDMTSPEITVRSAKELYEETGHRSGRSSDMCEVHDAFTIAEIMY